MIAHHEPLMLVQAATGVGASGYAAVLAARWYSLTRRVRRPTPIDRKEPT